VSPDGTQIAIGTSDRRIHIIDMDTETKQNRNAMILESIPTSLVWSPAGDKIASTSAESNIIRIWGVPEGDELIRVEHDDQVHSVTWSPNGDRIASGSSDRSVRLWDAGTGVQLTDFDYIQTIKKVAWSPDGNNIMALTLSGDIEITDVVSGEPVSDINYKPSKNKYDTIGSIAWSPDGKRVVTGLQGGSMLIWDAATGEILKRKKMKRKGVVYSVDWSPDGTKIAGGSLGGIITIWDASSGVTLHELRQESAVWSVKWTDDNTIVGFYRGGFMTIWKDLGNPQELRDARKMFMGTDLGDRVGVAYNKSVFDSTIGSFIHEDPGSVPDDTPTKCVIQ
jgi:WD40 repeat protein